MSPPCVILGHHLVIRPAMSDFPLSPFLAAGRSIAVARVFLAKRHVGAWILVALTHKFVGPPCR